MTSHFMTINLFTWGYNVLRHLWEYNSAKLSQKRKCENTIPENYLKGEGFENTIQQNCLKGNVLRIQFNRIVSKGSMRTQLRRVASKRNVLRIQFKKLPQRKYFENTIQQNCLKRKYENTTPQSCLKEKCFENTIQKIASKGIF